MTEPLAVAYRARLAQGELKPDPAQEAAVRAFQAGPGQGVNFAAGTWHHFNLALDGESDFLVIDREGPGENLEEVALAPFGPIAVAPTGNG